MAKIKKTKLDDFIRGDTPLLSFPMTLAGVPADLTGYTIAFTVNALENPTPTDTPIIHIETSGDTSGVASFQLLNDQPSNSTKDLVPGTTYYWDVQLWNNQSGAAKRIITVLIGSFQVVADIDRDES